MAVYEINLAKGRVAPPHRRRRQYWMLTLYIAVVGVIFVILANSITRELLTALARREQMPVLERKCLAASGAETADIVRYANTAGAEMQRHAETLEAVQAVFGRRVRVAQILLGLATPLPAEARLFSADLNAAKHEISFEVLTPDGNSTNGLSPLKLREAWALDPVIAAEVAGITSANSERSTVDGRSVLILRFTGRLAGKGS